MRTLRAVALVGVTVLAVVALASLTGATAATLDEDSETDEAQNASLGVQTGSFMQASSAGTESAVSEGMFDAEYDRAEDKGAVLDRRATGLEARLNALEQQKAALEEREDDDISAEIRMSRIASGIHSLDREVNNSAVRAERDGHPGGPFDDLSQSVADLRGPEVATAAGTIPSGPAPDAVGPSDDIPARNDEPDSPDDSGSEDMAEPTDDSDAVRDTGSDEHDDSDYKTAAPSGL